MNNCALKKVGNCINCNHDNCEYCFECKDFQNAIKESDKQVVKNDWSKAWEMVVEPSTNPHEIGAQAGVRRMEVQLGWLYQVQKEIFGHGKCVTWGEAFFVPGGAVQ